MEVFPDSEYAVRIQKLNKSYKSGPPVVNNLFMNVRKGTIYGLLGSSGCGKTTVLSCIVGLKKWDSGEVLVFGKRPGSKGSDIPGKRVGYMPQDFALYNQLSVREMIQFYGRLYNMTGKHVNERRIFLCELLQLPLKKFKLIGDLSGGQKRRASLALALLNSPELLVLDEPTVGLDPLLRTSIWNHLRNTVSTLGTTIIITTHYSEEARLLDTIGVMRNGKLLVEESPLKLLQNYGCEHLEKVVLRLCRENELKQGESASDTVSVFGSQQGTDLELQPTCSYSENNNVPLARDEHQMTSIISRELNQWSGGKTELIGDVETHKGIPSFRKIYGLTTVLLLTFIRYPAFLAFLLVMPSLQGTVTMWAVGPKPKDLAFGIVNHELKNWVEECNLRQHSENSSCDLSVLSCKYINALKRDDIFDLDEEDALDEAHLGKIWGYLAFPHNFTQHTLDRFAAGKFALNESIKGSEIHVRLDYSQNIASNFMTKCLMNSYLDYVKQLVESCNFDKQLAEIPLSFQKPVYGNAADDFTSFIMPGVILTFLYGVPITLTSILCVSDRKQGTLSRAMAAGLGTGDVIVSHLITQGIFVTFQFFIWNAVVYCIFGIPNHGATWLCLLFCLFAALAGTGLGIFVGVIFNDEVEAIIFGIFLVPIFLLFGGTFFPLENMSKIWQAAGSILPTTWSTLSLRSVIVRGAGLLHPTVWPGLLVLFAWVVAMPLCSALMFRKSCN